MTTPTSGTPQGMTADDVSDLNLSSKMLGFWCTAEQVDRILATHDALQAATDRLESAERNLSYERECREKLAAQLATAQADVARLQRQHEDDTAALALLHDANAACGVEIAELRAQLAEAQADSERLREALRTIALGEGKYSRDPMDGTIRVLTKMHHADPGKVVIELLPEELLAAFDAASPPAAPQGTEDAP